MIARGEVLVPGDKSITHRALMVAALSAGRCAFTSPLAAGDTRSTAAALRSLGIKVGPLSAQRVSVTGGGMRPFRAPPLPPSAPLPAATPAPRRACCSGSSPAIRWKRSSPATGASAAGRWRA